MEKEDEEQAAPGDRRAAEVAPVANQETPPPRSDYQTLWGALNIMPMGPARHFTVDPRQAFKKRKVQDAK